MGKFQVSVGQRFIDDEGDEVTVRKVNRTSGTVVLQGEGGKYEMGTTDLDEALETGEFEDADDDSEDDGVA
jgi:hypothetical protein